MKRVYELNVCKLAEELSDIVWHGFDKWNKKVQNTVGYQIIRSSDSIAANIAEGMVGILPLTGKSFIYIQEVYLKKPNHGCGNSSEEKFYLSQTRQNTKQ
jgi:hypothetical protein